MYVFIEEIDAIESSAKSSSSKSKGSKKKCPPCNAALLSDHIRTLEDEIESLTTILKTMKRDHNHNFHDLAVKAAIGGYDEFIDGYDELKAEIDKDLISEDDYTFENADEEIEEEEQVEIEDPVEKAGMFDCLFHCSMDMRTYLRFPSYTILFGYPLKR